MGRMLHHHGILYSIASDRRSHFIAKNSLHSKRSGAASTGAQKSAAFPGPHHPEAAGLVQRPLEDSATTGTEHRAVCALKRHPVYSAVAPVAQFMGRGTKE